MLKRVTFAIFIVVILVCSAPARASVILDANGNGVSNIWEARYGLSDPVENSDSDQDGQSDREEAVSGTDPWDPASRFLLEIEGSHPESPYLKWFSKSGKRYQVEALDPEGHWWPLGDVIPGNGAMVGFSDLTNGGNSPMLYRVAVVGGGVPIRDRGDVVRHGYGRGWTR